MVKPRKQGAARRRVATISLYGGSFVVLTASAPAWIAIAFLVGMVRRRSFVVLRLLTFAWFYFGFELVALVRVALRWFRHRHDRRRLELSMTELQGWWASVVMSVACRLLRLDVVVDGAERATPGPAILLVRHASILDTLLPCVYLQRPSQWQVRYILKQELLVDPCLDVVGHILPNYFVDRTGDTTEELRGIRVLVEELRTDGVLIFPEGTRFSPQKRERALARIAADMPERLADAQSLEGVLPPKPGGVLTLLDALPEVDCVFLAHTGLEDLAKVKDLLSGRVVGSTIRIWVWRVSAKSIPTNAEERLRWLFGQWADVSALVMRYAEA